MPKVKKPDPAEIETVLELFFNRQNDVPKIMVKTGLTQMLVKGIIKNDDPPMSRSEKKKWSKEWDRIRKKFLEEQKK